MSLIGATKIKWHWALVTDDAVTIWQKTFSCARRWRPKLRSIQGKNVKLYIASCWTTKDIDYIINMLEKEIHNFEPTDTRELWERIQEMLFRWYRDLRDIKEEPNFAFLILEPSTETLWASEEYSCFIPKDEAEIAMGSAEQTYHQLKDRGEGFAKVFQLAALSNEFCLPPFTCIWDEHLYREDNLLDIMDKISYYPDLITNQPDNGWKTIHSETTSSN